MMGTGTTISVEHAAVRYGRHIALDNFTATFQPGTVSALIGGDGAGKTILLKALAGRVPITGETVTGIPVDPRNLGYQPADSGVWRNLSVAENIEFVARAYGMDADTASSRARELLDRAGLAHAKGRLAGRLSGGMRQKLGVVLATLHQPGVVLLDEPTTGVDPVSRAELWSLIAQTAAEGATVVFATTYLDEAERAGALYLLDKGHLHAAGTPEDVVAHTPGTIWEAPAHSDVPTGGLTWRRGGTVYLWTPDGAASSAPPGFAPAEPDLENTSIALMLAKDRDGGATGLSPEPRRGDAGVDKQLVTAENIVRTYGAFTALKEVSLSVRPGEIVGLLGGNGAGKTTLMRILLGLETPTSGHAALFGSKPTLKTRRRIGYVAQGLGLYPSLSALENLAFAASVHGVEINEEARAFAEQFGRAPVADLPLGTRRTLAYWAATQHQPELLVLDEPTSGMDSLSRARLWKQLHTTTDRGVGILVTTHYMQEAAQCDRLILLSHGTVTAAGTVREITSGVRSLAVTTAQWDQAFLRLRNAGLPVLLDGRVLRVPGASRDEVARALESLDAVTIAAVPATLEETMMVS